MVTVKELRALAISYGLPGRSKLKKNDLIKAIAEVRATEFIKRLSSRHRKRRDTLPFEVMLRTPIKGPPWPLTGTDQR